MLDPRLTGHTKPDMPGASKEPAHAPKDATGRADGDREQRTLHRESSGEEFSSWGLVVAVSVLLSPDVDSSIVDPEVHLGSRHSRSMPLPMVRKKLGPSRR